MRILRCEPLILWYSHTKPDRSEVPTLASQLCHFTKLHVTRLNFGSIITQAAQLQFRFFIFRSVSA
jgi:hypothetical protein